MAFSLSGSSVHGDSSGKGTGVGCHALPQWIFPTGIELRSPVLQVDSLQTEPPGEARHHSASPIVQTISDLTLVQQGF